MNRPTSARHAKARPHGERITVKRAALRLRIDVALKAFAAQGFENTKTADIADQLQMTGPALYHYFATKNELLFACLSQIMDQLLASATSASTGTAGPRERLASVVRTQVAIELKYGSTAPLINAHLYGPKYLTQMVEEGNQALLQQKPSSSTRVSGTVQKRAASHWM